LVREEIYALVEVLGQGEKQEQEICMHVYVAYDYQWLMSGSLATAGNHTVHPVNILPKY
jgi:hypothetical protein